MENQQASAHVKPLSLVDMSSAFVVLGLGISLSIFVFLVELIYKRIKNHYFTDEQVVPSETKQSERQEVITVPVELNANDQVVTSINQRRAIPPRKANTKQVRRPMPAARAYTKQGRVVPSKVKVLETKPAHSMPPNANTNKKVDTKLVQSISRPKASTNLKKEIAIKTDSKQSNSIPVEVEVHRVVDETKQVRAVNIPPAGNQRNNNAAIIASFDEILEM